ncbi:MAG: hypothetical protein Q8N96_04085 [Methylovulum sp.]|nr:hypothetical protein [Methylovulum sp.]
MNILWIEDFGGNLPAGRNILNQMFGELLGFDAWDNDLFSLNTKPSDLNEFCTQQKSLHTLYLCRNYFDFAEFKKNHTILNEIDAVIIDVRLDNGEHVDLEKDIPAPYTDKSKFHENGGFYIFNDLIHLGVPAEIMCFMTGEKNSIDDFKEKCSSIYIPEVKAFEKKDPEYENLRIWIKNQESDYIKLRRGIIEGCQHIVELIQEKKLVSDSLRFNDFISEPEKQVSIEDMRDYVEVLEKFLPLREPSNKAAMYKLFIRTIAHEWEAADPKKIKGLAWIMKNTRNWIVHNPTLFNELDEKTLAYLFIINIRLMFDIDEAVQRYEKMLLNLFVEDAVSEIDFKTKTVNKLIPFSKAYLELKNLVLDERRDKSQKINVQDGFYFNELANNIQQSNSSFRNDKPLFTKLLYQMFWLTTSNPYVDTGYKRNLLEIKFWDFKYPEKTYFFEVARHIYNRSFP